MSSSLIYFIPLLRIMKAAEPHNCFTIDTCQVLILGVRVCYTREEVVSRLWCITTLTYWTLLDTIL